jgi:hypothetical protein
MTKSRSPFSAAHFGMKRGGKAKAHHKRGSVAGGHEHLCAGGRKSTGRADRRPRQGGGPAGEPGAQLERYGREQLHRQGVDKLKAEWPLSGFMRELQRREPGSKHIEDRRGEMIGPPLPGEKVVGSPMARIAPRGFQEGGDVSAMQTMPENDLWWSGPRSLPPPETMNMPSTPLLWQPGTPQHSWQDKVGGWMMEPLQSPARGAGAQWRRGGRTRP